MSPRGGWRGGGRPAISEELKRQTLTCRIAPETKLWLEEKKAETDKSIGELVDLAVEALQKHPATELANLTADDSKKHPELLLDSMEEEDI